MTSASPNPRFRSLLLDGLFYGAFFLYLLLCIDPAAIYYHEAPIFLNRWEIYHAFSTSPGAPLHYAAALLVYVGQIPWLGALVITLLAFALAQVCKAYLCKTTGQRPMTAHLVPGLCVLLVFNQYDAPAVKILLAATLGAGFALACLLLPNAKLRVPAAIIAVLGLHWVAGPAAAMLAGTMAGVFELKAARNRVAGLVLLIFGIAGPWTIATLVESTPGVAISSWGHLPSEVAAILLVLWIPLSPLFNKAAQPQPAPEPDTKKKSKGTAKAAPSRSLPLRPALFGFAVLVTAFLLNRTLDIQKRGLLQVDFHADKQHWNSVLRVASSLRESTLASRLQVLRALYYLGQLPERQFQFEQFQKIELFPGLDRGAGAEFCLPLAHTLLELGQVNLAEHFAHEAMELKGSRPEALEVIIKLNLAKGRIPVARIYLNLLAQHPFHRDWARGYLTRLETDPLLSNDEEIVRIRQRLVKSDITSNNEPTFLLLSQLLQANPKNQMAFEYLLSNYLVTIETDKFMKILEQYETFSYSKMPRYCQEAILMHQWLHKDQPASPLARFVTPETAERFARFKETFDRNGGKAKAKDILQREYPDTYWFFALYGFSPGIPYSSQGGSL